MEVLACFKPGFSSRQDASETLLKKRGHQSIFWKQKMAKESLKNTHALMAERDYGSY